jgi:hypothetical protein
VLVVATKLGLSVVLAVAAVLQELPMTTLAGLVLRDRVLLVVVDTPLREILLRAEEAVQVL